MVMNKEQRVQFSYGYNDAKKGRVLNGVSRSGGPTDDEIAYNAFYFAGALQGMQELGEDEN